MMIEDSDYLSIFDIELRKAQKIFTEANKNFIIKVGSVTLHILETSPNFMIIKGDKNQLIYMYRNQYQIVFDDNLNMDSDKDFVFEEVIDG